MDGMDAGSRRVTPSPPSGRSCNPVRENPVILSTRNRMNLEFDEEQGILRQTVREFAEVAFAHLGLDYRDYVTIDPALVRPAEVELLLGCTAKAERELGWHSRTRFRDLVVEMVEADLAACQEDVGHRASP